MKVPPAFTTKWPMETSKNIYWNIDTPVPPTIP